MKKVFTFICEHPIRIAISLALIAWAFHWGVMGFIPIFIGYLIWE